MSHLVCSIHVGSPRGEVVRCTVIYANQEVQDTIQSLELFPSTVTIALMDLRRILALPSLLRVSNLDSARAFSVLNRPPPNYEGHVPLNIFEKGALAAGSAVMSLVNPRRGGMFCMGYDGVEID